MKDIAVAILNWNGRDLLEEFVPSVIKYSSLADVIVIDNNSTDESLAFLAANYPEIQIIQTGKNIGYAGGYNFALNIIKNEYVVLLNSDVEVTEGWLEAPLQAFEADKNIGAIQPKIKDKKQKTHFEYAGAAGGFIDNYAYPFCRGRLFNDLEEDLGQYDDNQEIFWASGACMFVRRNAYMKAGKLDESFFAHMEEIDLCWRMKNNGYSIQYIANSTVYHLGGATLDSQSPRKTFLNFRNNLYLVFKNIESSALLRVIFMRLILDGVAGVYFLVLGKPKHLWAIIRAHFAFYANFNQLIKKRFIARKKLVGFKTHGVYNNLIIVDYFLKKKKRYSDLAGKFNI